MLSNLKPGKKQIINFVTFIKKPGFSANLKTAKPICFSHADSFLHKKAFFIQTSSSFVEQHHI
jgi:hypothetical protein